MASAAPSASPRPDRNGAMRLDRLGPPEFRFTEFRFIDFRAPRLPYLSPLRGREGADGQAGVCPLLRGSSPTRGVAPKQHRGLRRAFTPAFRAGSLYPLARGCRRIWRGEGWFRPARCCSTGSGRLNLDLLISGPPRLPYLSPLARARALLARPWSAGCYGVARQREGSRQNSIEQGRLLTNRPCSSLVYEESDSKERLRVSNWIVQRLYNYAVKKTVEL